MKAYFLLLLLIFAMVVNAYKAKPDEKVTVYACRDRSERLFFVGEKEHYEDFLKRGVFSKSSCRSADISVHKWMSLRRRRRKLPHPL